MVVLNESEGNKVFIAGPHDMKSTVTVSGEDQMVRCECKKFEFKGIPCMHILAYFRQMDLQGLPPEHVLRRWCVDANKDSTFNNEINQISKGKESRHCESTIFNVCTIK